MPDYRSPTYQHPVRKPVAAPSAGLQFSSSSSLQQQQQQQTPPSSSSPSPSPANAASSPRPPLMNMNMNMNMASAPSHGSAYPAHHPVHPYYQPGAGAAAGAGAGAGIPSPTAASAAAAARSPFPPRGHSHSGHPQAQGHGHPHGHQGHSQQMMHPAHQPHPHAQVQMQARGHRPAYYQQQQSQQQHQQQQQFPGQFHPYAHHHQNQHQYQHQHQHGHPQPTSNRRVSTATTASARSTATAATAAVNGQSSTPMHRVPSHATSHTDLVRRSSSTTSGGTINLHGSPSNAGGKYGFNPRSSYVANMRRQRATVWSDRMQAEDPRVVAARKAAKRKAAQEISSQANRNSMLLLPGGGNGKTGYTPANLMLMNARVPVRLLANEVDDGNGNDADSNAIMQQRMQQQQLRGRTNSGRSVGAGTNGSGSMRRDSITQPGGDVRHSSASIHSTTGIPHIVEPAVQGDGQKEGSGATEGQAHGTDRPTSATSDGSATEEDFGKLTEMVGPASKQKMTSLAEELKRRGSVDERTSTMKGVRLFVANPDLE